MVDILRFLARRAQRLIADDDDGVAAVEMAFLAPVALGFLSLAVAGGQTLTMYHKTVRAAHAVTDLVSRTNFTPDTYANVSGAELLTGSQLTGDMALSQLILYPSDASALQIVVSELHVDPNTNQGTVQWSKGYNGGTALSNGTRISLDPSYVASGATYLIYGQAQYTFQPLGGIWALPPISLTSWDMLTIRNANSITLNPSQ